MVFDSTLKAGTVSGTLLSIVPHVLSDDIIRTVLLATVGAVVSFAVTLLLKWIAGSKTK